MLDPLHSLHWLLRRRWAHMLARRVSPFLLSFVCSPTAASSTCVSVRGDSRYLACTKPAGKVGSDGFNFCRVRCTDSPQLLTSWTLVCSLRCRFIAASLVSGPARFRVDTAPWLCVLSPLNTSIGIRVCTASCFVNESWGARARQPDSMTYLGCRVARIEFDHGRVGQG